MATKHLYFAGTAGCGKSTMTRSFQLWLQGEGYDAITVNLDPGVETIPYVPEVDIRDWIRLSEVMADHGLGPNGAQIVAADMVALNVDEVVDVLSQFDSDYVLVDTPGQLELFAFRQSSRAIMERIGPESSALAFLIDPVLARTANGFVTSLMLSATTHFRLPVPQVLVLSKADLVTDEERERIESWGQDYYALFNSLLEESPDAQTLMSMEFMQALETVGIGSAVSLVSSESGEGLDEIYIQVQNALQGGEDADS
jgi:GTPase SAR1 family protein